MKRNRKFLGIVLAGMLCMDISGVNAETAIPVDSRIEAKVDSILRRLTLEEKIGQMTQLTLDVVGK